jgi:hypothetical protein
MAKRSGASAFDELLETFSTQEDRKAFEDIATKYPQVKEYGLRQSDYSRQLNELNEQITELNEWRDWRSRNWDDQRGMTTREVARLQELEELKTQKEQLEQKVAFGGLGGDDMNFEQLENWGKEFAAKNGFLTKDAISAKEQELRELVIGTNSFTANAALLVPYLNQRHQQEFGELFEPDQFLRDATAKNRHDLKDYYEKEFVVEKREAKRKADYESEIARVKSEADERVKKADENAQGAIERLKGMGPQGQSPADADGPQMASFQRKYLGLDKKPEDGSGAPEVSLGEGGIAAYAAHEFIQQKANRP